MNSPPYSTLVSRAALPELMFIPDLAIALQASEVEAEAALQRGECGPFVRVAGRLAVLRESFLDALARREESPLGRAPRRQSSAPEVRS